MTNPESDFDPNNSGRGRLQVLAKAISWQSRNRQHVIDWFFHSVVPDSEEPSPSESFMNKCWIGLGFLFSFIAIKQFGWTFYLALLSAITIHELGHYLAACLIGLPIVRFSIGIGPRLFQIPRFLESHGLSLEFRGIPFGGYVEQLVLPTALKNFYWSWRKSRSNNTPQPDFPATFDPTDCEPLSTDLSLWRNLLFISGGLIANLLLSIILSSILIQAEDRFFYTNHPEYEMDSKNTGALSPDHWLAISDRIWSTGTMIIKFLPEIYFERLAISNDAVDVAPEESPPEESSQTIPRAWQSELYDQSMWMNFLLTFLFVNIVLLFINLLPIPPLDGYRFLETCILRLNPPPFVTRTLKFFTWIGIVAIASILLLDLWLMIDDFFSGE